MSINLIVSNWPLIAALKRLFNGTIGVIRLLPSQRDWKFEITFLLTWIISFLILSIFEWLLILNFSSRINFPSGPIRSIQFTLLIFKPHWSYSVHPVLFSPHLSYLVKFEQFCSLWFYLVQVGLIKVHLVYIGLI